MDPYTDQDPEYRDTLLESPIPIPSAETCPPPHRQHRNYDNRHSQSSNYRGSSHRSSNYRDPPNYRDSNYQDSNYKDPSNNRDSHHSQSSSHPLPPNPFAAQRVSNARSNQSQQSQRSKIELPNQRFSFLACQIAYKEGEPISGLNMKVGPVLEPDYNQFCMKEIVESLLEEKKRLTDVPHGQLTAARGKSNPYEKVGDSIFMNRAAMKLACLDAQLGLTGIKRYDPVKDLVFWFADLCGGPGGFAEYLLWRKNSLGERIFGWGITLIGEQDYDLERFHPDAMVKSHFKRVYGKDDTGDLYKEENMRQFANVVMKGTNEVGVDLITADGGFDVRGRESQQERLTKRLLLCQIITMFMTLRKGGDFVLKVFDVFTPFTAGLIWILYRHFENICITKPLPSRPANSERYVICRNLKEHHPKTTSYLRKVNRKFDDIRSSAPSSPSSGEHHDVNTIVEFEVMENDEEFMNYLETSNMKIAVMQTDALKNLQRYIDEPALEMPDQDEYRRLCLQEWRITKAEE